MAADSPSSGINATPTPKLVFTPPPIRATLSPADEALLLRTEKQSRTESTLEAADRSRPAVSEPFALGTEPMLQETQNTGPVETAKPLHASPRSTQVEVIRPKVEGDSLQTQKDSDRLRSRTARSDPYFTTEPGNGEKAKLTLSNDFSDAVVTFVAVPVERIEPVNVILGIGESRCIEIEPGNYEVRISAMNNRYPPATVLRQHFHYTFEAATTYHRRFGPDAAQHIP